MEWALSHRGGKDDRDRTPGSAARRRSNEPGWAQGLRKLYNSVLDEPIPDSFDDLLKKLDRNRDEQR
ncbi:MAG TPA: NepR family anti-sigma factor [Novosphingobium sp.]